MSDDGSDAILFREGLTYLRLLVERTAEGSSRHEAFEYLANRLVTVSGE
jgi:hypothetical protein